MPSRYLELDYTHSLANVVGRRHGLSQSKLVKTARKLADCCDLWAQGGKHRLFAFAQLPYAGSVGLEKLLDTAHRKRKFRHLVVSGMGGSALGLRAIQSALQDDINKKVTVVDNIDPDTLERLSQKLNLKTTLFNFITKSAATPETLAHFLYFRREMERREKKLLTENIVLTLGTSPSDIEKACPGVDVLEIPHDVGGRFSVLTSVGLFPAAWAGVPVLKMLEGAREIASYIRETPPENNPLHLSTALLCLLCDKGKRIQVMMPYADSLVDFAHWWAQLWGESLGKRKNRQGRIVNAGQTPVVARGASDQHSQLQLWTEGPKDKVISFLNVREFRYQGRLSSRGKKFETMEYLSGKTLQKLLQAEAFATSVSLADAECPNLSFTVPRLSPEVMGALFYFFECQTALAGEYFNINAFNQPGVEAGKQATFALMGRLGYTKMAGRLNKRMRKRFTA